MPQLHFNFRIFLKSFLVSILINLSSYLLHSQNDCSDYAASITESLICSPSDFIIIFEDSFSGNDLNLDYWRYVEGVSRDNVFFHSKQYYQKNNIEVNNNKLKLWAKYEPMLRTYEIWDNDLQQMVSHTNFFDYTSAEIWSKFNFNYGIFECVTKIPSEEYYFPAFWAYQQHIFPYNNNAMIDEFDIFEFHKYKKLITSLPPTYSTTPYSTWRMTAWHRSPTQGSETKGCQFKDNTLPLQNNVFNSFNSFKGYFLNYKLSWTLNDIVSEEKYKWTTLQGSILQCEAVQPNNNYFLKEYFPRNPMQIVANLAIYNGNEGLWYPNSSDFVSQALEFDVIRYWAQEPCVDKIISSYTYKSMPGNNNEFDYIYADNLTVSGNITIPTGEQLLLVGTEIIVEGEFDSNGQLFEIAYRNPCNRNHRISELENESEHFKETETNKFEIFPNPTFSFIEIKINETTEISMYEIIDFLGRRRTSGYINSNSKIVDLNEFEPGIYTVIIKNTYQILQKTKIIKL